MGMEVPGKRRRGRPKRRWSDSIRNVGERTGEDAQDVEASHKTHRPHIKVGKYAEEEEDEYTLMPKSVFNITCLGLRCV